MDTEEPQKKPNGIDKLVDYIDHSWVERLNPDPESEHFAPNKRSRQVKSGHYVPVLPTPLPAPLLVSVSPEMAAEVGLTPEDCQDARFKLFFSGYLNSIENAAGQAVFKSWATPYALAIYGQDMYHNCPFGNGNGYGDGRAISIGEVRMPNGNRWEFQLKGGGTTPFCRGGDGRAVLRSSVREFLVSEAMFHLGVPTTRALCLVQSLKEVVARPWFSGKSSYSQEPDVMVNNKAAITTRVAPSFLRVGHLQLFERRVRRNNDPTALEFKMGELKLLIEHCLHREYPHINEKFRIHPDLPEKVELAETSSVKDMKEFLKKRGVDISQCFEKPDLWKKIQECDLHPTRITPPEELYGPLQPRALQMLREASLRFAELMANWQRVGYCQGNFNSDNCLVGGRTMDYGPFGFIELYDPAWCMWTGGAPHFSFGNQPVAGIKNFTGLASAIRPALDDAGAEEITKILKKHYENTMNTVNMMWSSKLGFNDVTQETKEILSTILELMEKSAVDFTMFWRELPVLVERYFSSENLHEINENDWIEPLAVAFYQPPCRLTQWSAALQKWMALLKLQQAGQSPEKIAAGMRLVSPKYVPREWMLVDAYNAADDGDFTLLEELKTLFRKPYDEQSEEMEKKYYKKPPFETFKGVGVGGKAFMT